MDLPHDLERRRRQQRGEQRSHGADRLHLLLSCVRLPWASRLHLHILLACTHEVLQLLNVWKLIEASSRNQRLRSVGPQGKGRSENTRRANSKVHPTCLSFMPPGTKHLALGTSLVVALEHSRVLAIFCSTVFTSDHPCIESKHCNLNTWVV